tara:strand:- start:314 stop:535 length:222 start_codon:yes stop_codon:yes gene_type:complete
MSNMLDRGDHDEFLSDCPWIKEDAEYCDAHDLELSYGENEDGQEFRYCKFCEEATSEILGVADVCSMWKGDSK